MLVVVVMLLASLGEMAMGYTFPSLFQRDVAYNGGGFSFANAGNAQVWRYFSDGTATLVKTSGYINDYNAYYTPTNAVSQIMATSGKFTYIAPNGYLIVVESDTSIARLTPYGAFDISFGGGTGQFTVTGLTPGITIQSVITDSGNNIQVFGVLNQGNGNYNLVSFRIYQDGSSLDYVLVLTACGHRQLPHHLGP